MSAPAPDAPAPDGPAATPAGGSARAPRPARPGRTPAGTAGLVLAAAVLVVLAVGAWQRRWMADDGLIVLRTVRNLLAGNGPVFNAGERVESNTSTLWTYLVTAFGWVPGSLELTTVVLCLVLTLAGLACGMLAARELHAGAGLLLPLGALVYVVLPPARDFATSGLETGLVLSWLGLLALLLARRAAPGPGGVARHPAVGALPVALVAGLGPLVRPELAVVGGLALLLLLAGPLGWRHRAVLVAVAAALPLAYQVFRMAYYGLPYPVTAVAKEASDSQWGRGWGYVTDLAGTYWLWLVLAVLLVLGLASVRRRPAPTTRHGAAGAAVPDDDTEAEAETETGTGAAVPRALRRGAVVGWMLASGLLYVLYVVRVGGDFMHGRMLLPGLFLLLLPVMEVPLPQLARRGAGVVLGVAGALVVGGWAVVALLTGGPSYGTDISAAGIADERAFYVARTGDAHPIEASDYLSYPPLAGMFPALELLGDRGGMVWAGPDPLGYWEVVPTADPVAPQTIFFINMGMTSMNVGLDVRVVDNVGLSNPVAAHSEPLPGGRVGHSKIIPPDWEAAGQGLLPNPSLNPRLVADARDALACTRTDEMLDSYRDPLTLDRAWLNLRGALSRASYRYSYEPDVAAAQCGTAR